MKKLFITDFDGTLLTDDRTVSQRDIRMLERLRQNHVHTAIATGRSLYSLTKALEALCLARGAGCLPVDYLIFSTGAGIMRFESSRMLFEQSLPGKEIQGIVAYFKSKDIDFMVHKAIPDTRHFFYHATGKGNPDFEHRIRMYQAYSRPLPDIWDAETPATEVLAILPGRHGHDRVARIQEDLKGFSVIHATSPLDRESAWVEVFHQNVSKSRAARYLARHLAVDRCNVIGVGNDFNDQDLLDWSGRSFMVENGPERLKSRYEVVPENNRCGVSRAVELSGWLDLPDGSG